MSEPDQVSDEATIYPSLIADLHTAAMDGAHLNFEAPESGKLSAEEKAKYLADFNLATIAKSGLVGPEQADNLRESLTVSEGFAIPGELDYLAIVPEVREIRRRARLATDNQEEDDPISYLNEKGSLNDAEQDLLERTFSALYHCETGSAPFESFADSLEVIKAEFGRTDLTEFENGQDGLVALSMLALTEASYEWWGANPDAADEYAQSIQENARTSSVMPGPAAVVVADISGAAFSAAITAGGQYALNGSIDGRAVAWSAVGGAITASTGLVGRVLRLFRLAA